MYPRTNFEMSEEDLNSILEASRPTPAMFLSGGTPMIGSPQENANVAWATIGQKMGFDYMTVRPIDGKGQRFFTAIPSETEDQRKDRAELEAKEARKREIARLTDGIADLQQKLADLTRAS